MRTPVNLVLTLAALVVATLLRFTSPGWLLLIFVMYLVGPLLMLTQLVVAAVATGRPRLPTAVAVPSGVSAVCLVVANLLIADFGDGPRQPSPLEGATGLLPEAVQGVGWALLLVWAAGVLWTVIALCVTWASPSVAPAPPAPAAPPVRSAP